MTQSQNNDCGITGDSPSRTIRRRGMRQFATGMALYAVVIVLTVVFAEPRGVDLWLGVILAIVPVACAVWGMAGWLRAVRTFDELKQKMFSEAGLVSFGITAVVTFTYGLLEDLAGLPKLSMLFVFPFMGLCYALSIGPITRRYQ